jgi:hypothetical protein
MARRRIYGVAAAAAAGAVLVATPSSATTAPELHSPDTAKSDYDIQNYKLALGYDRPAREVNATTTITATTESPTRAFALDFDRVPKAATVNGVPATVTKNGDQTIITIDRTLPEGEKLTIVLTYTVTPPSTQDGAGFPELRGPDGETDLTKAGLPAGWLPQNVRPDAATFALVSALPAQLRAWKTEHGMRYLDKAADVEKTDPATAAGPEHAAAVRAAVEQRAAKLKAAREAAAERRADRRERAEAERAEWKQHAAARGEERGDRGDRGHRGDRNPDHGHDHGRGGR